MLHNLFKQPHPLRLFAYTAGVAMGLACFAASPAQAHFLEVIPESPVIDQSSGPKQSLEIRFTHPMDGGPVMDLAGLEALVALQNGAYEDLLPALKEAKEEGQRTYRVRHQVTAPGDIIYAATPKPYWEPAEGKLIVHYTKVVVDAYGAGEGWDALLGLPVEIEPLTRPYGNWTGSVFQGRVLVDGTPRPFAEIEIEYRGQGQMAIPADSYVTQVIKADENGVFTVALPRQGWWGFAALVTGQRTGQSPDGKTVPVEDGGLLWVYVHDMTTRSPQ